MQVIICDDEKRTCVNLKGILNNYAINHKLELEINIFLSGDTLVDYLYENENVDILFLDIELPGLDGIKVGNYIRKVMANEQIFIVYISSKEQYAMQLFKNRPFDFVVKPLDENRIFSIMDNIYRIIENSNENFQYQNKGITYRIRYGDILYFQSIGRRINIIMKNETKSFYGKLVEVQARLPQYIFLSIHKSYIINFNYVREYTYEWVKMINEDVLNISKKNRAQIRRKILEIESDEVSNR